MIDLICELARFAKLLDPTFALPGLFSDARICPVPDDPLGVCPRHGYLPLPGAHGADLSRRRLAPFALIFPAALPARCAARPRRHQ